MSTANKIPQNNITNSKPQTPDSKKSIRLSLSLQDYAQLTQLAIKQGVSIDEIIAKCIQEMK